MSAPPTRRVDMLTGRKAPDVFFKALSEADDFIRQLDRGTLAQADADDAAETIGELLHERDGLACRLDELTEELDDVRGLLRMKVNECADLARKLELMTAERDNWRAAAQCVRNA